MKRLFYFSSIIGLSNAFSPRHSSPIVRPICHKMIGDQQQLLMSSTPTESLLAATVATDSLKPGESIHIIDNVLYPKSDYKHRMDIGKDSQFGEESSVAAVKANDPRLSLTYHEFPLQSLDMLLELAIDTFELKNGRKPNVLVDLGSGCGRLVLYPALASAESDCDILWKEVHGIEISSLMHDYAVSILEKGSQQGIFSVPSNDSKDIQIYLHQGPASEMKDVLSQADIIFCYSTVFDSDGFDVDIGAMVLAKEWSQLLADVCKSGTVVITTDRALNPVHGWSLNHTLEVENPSLIGSTGYVSIRQ